MSNNKYSVPCVVVVGTNSILRPLVDVSNSLSLVKLF